MNDAARVLTLAIESSNPTADPERPGSVAIGALTQTTDPSAPPSVLLRGSRALALTGRHDDALAPAIEALLRETSVAPNLIGLVAVSAGPGGYTALRIAVTTAMLFAEAVGARCARVPTTLVAAYGSARVGSFAVALASKRETSWVAVFERARPGAAPRFISHEPGSLADAHGLVALHERHPFDALLCDAPHLPPAMREWADERAIALEPLGLDAESCLRAAANIAPIDPGAITPIYPREPEAVSKWNATRSL